MRGGACRELEGAQKGSLPDHGRDSGGFLCNAELIRGFSGLSRELQHLFVGGDEA